MQPYDPTLDEPWRNYHITSPKWVTPDEWVWCLGHNLSWACTLRFAASQGWWDGAGYHKSELKRQERQLNYVPYAPKDTSGVTVIVEDYRVTDAKAVVAA